MDSILSAFSSSSKDEKLCLQIIVEPLSEDWLKKMRKKCEEIKNDDGLNGFQRFWNKLTKDQKKQDEEKEKQTKYNFSQQQLGDFEKKMDDEMFHVKIRALAISPDKNNTKKMISDLTRLFNQYNYMGLNSFKFEKADNIQKFTKDFILRSLNSEKNFFFQLFCNEESQILNIKELSSLIHFPHGRFNLNPRIAWQKFKIVAAPDNLPNEGLTVGFNEFAGVKRAIRITDKDRFRHVYILGQTGT